MTPDQKKEYQRAWIANNREKKREYTRRSMAKLRAKNREAFNETCRRWRRENRDRTREVEHRSWQRIAARTGRTKNDQIQEWRDRNPGKTNEYALTRRTRKKNARGFCSAEQLRGRIAIYGGLCAYCKQRPFQHIDHVIPLSRGGTSWPSNLRPACQPCNNSKINKLLSEWKGPLK